MTRERAPGAAPGARGVTPGGAAVAAGVDADFRLRLSALVAAGLVRGLGRTLRFSFLGVDYLREARERSPDGRVIFCFWHGRQLPLTYSWRGRGVRTFVSWSRDGEFQRQALERLGYRTIRGSTTRGGAPAILRALRRGDPADLALSPDGPRGPRERFSAGAIFLAAHSRLPIVPLGTSARRAWRLGSWDAYQIPKPFSAVRVVIGPPLFVPPHVRGDERDRWRGVAERALAAATAAADSWGPDAATGRGPADA